MTRAHNIDCMKATREMGDNQFDLAICDVPYGIGVGKMSYLSETKTTVKQKNGTRLNPRKNKTPYQEKDWDVSVPLQDYIDELMRVSVNQIVFGVEYAEWVGIGEGRIKWNKGVADGMSFKKYELAYCSLINDTVQLNLLWAGMCQAKSLKEPMTQQGNKKLNEKRIHPTHKPILLYKKLLLDYAKEGDTILDTHLGSGSSRIACHDMGFDFTGYEIDHDYFQAQEKRFNNHIQQQSLFSPKEQY